MEDKIKMAIGYAKQGDCSAVISTLEELSVEIDFNNYKNTSNLHNVVLGVLSSNLLADDLLFRAKTKDNDIFVRFAMDFINGRILLDYEKKPTYKNRDDTFSHGKYKLQDVVIMEVVDYAK